MSDRIKGVLTSKWTIALLLGVGTVAAAGGLVLVVYAVRKQRQRSAVTNEVPPSPAPAVVQESVEPQSVHETAEVMEDVQLMSSSAPLEATSPYYASFVSRGTDETDFPKLTNAASATYEGVYVDVQNLLKPLFDSSSLHSAFIQYVQPSAHAVDKLKALSAYLHQYEGTLKADRPAPSNTSPEINPILNELSSDTDVKLDEMKSLILLSEAFLEFPPHVVKRSLSLPQEKRQTLIDLICATPYGIDKHVYMDEGPYNDPDLYPIMTRLGFSIPSYQTKLQYEAPDDRREDKLAAGLFLLLGTDSTSTSS